jgi:hypothetical protein
MVGAERAQTAEFDMGWDRADSASDQPSSGQAIAIETPLSTFCIPSTPGIFPASGARGLGIRFVIATRRRQAVDPAFEVLRNDTTILSIVRAQCPCRPREDSLSR